MSIDYGFPQPTEDELNEEVISWLSFNPFWWQIAQGKIKEISNPALWDDYTAAIDQGIMNLMQPHELPIVECPEVPAIWCHLFDFHNSLLHGWTLIRGTATTAGIMQATSGGIRGSEISRDFASRTILGVTALVSHAANMTATGAITINNNAADIYRNTAEPTGLRKQFSGSGNFPTVTNLRVSIGTATGSSGLIQIHGVVVWGEGTNPF